jgi:transposase InsO family protein
LGVRAIQVDGGSEFQAVFEEACRRQRIRLFVLPPRCPKLNGCIERSFRTDDEEFYQVEQLPADVGGLEAALLSGTMSTRGCGLTTPWATRPQSGFTKTGLQLILGERRYCPICLDPTGSGSV